MKLTASSNQRDPKLIAIAAVAAVVAVAIATYGFLQLRQRQIASRESSSSQPRQAPRVSALGRLEPETEIVNVAVPLTLDGDQVIQLNIQEGEMVQQGEVIAILAARSRLQSALQQAQEQVKVAQARLVQVEAGAKRGEINAQSATIRRLQAQWEGDRTEQRATIQRLQAQIEGDELAKQATIRRLDAELANATAEVERYQRLHAEGAISDSFLDTQRLSLETSRQQLKEAQAELKRIQRTGEQQLKEAKATLARLEQTSLQDVSAANATLSQIEEVRPVDIEVARAELQAAIATMKQAEVELEQTLIRAPITGRILSIYTRQGEKVSTDGIAAMGATQNMMAIAEVYQSDIGKVRLGQAAQVRGQAFSGTLEGRVVQIQPQVSRQNVFSNEPGENLDLRVIEVKIRLNAVDSQKVAHLTNLQVQTLIEVDETPVAQGLPSLSPNPTLTAVSVP